MRKYQCDGDLEEYDDPEKGRLWRCWFIGEMRTTRTFQKVPEECVLLVRRLWDRKIGRKYEPSEWVWPPLSTATPSPPSIPRIDSTDPVSLQARLERLAAPVTPRVDPGPSSTRQAALPTKPPPPPLPPPAGPPHASALCLQSQGCGICEYVL